jgi:crotonobetainyl-CoA:carnitine CoA-transferase CaiB-like acyl-CoA transferase
VMERLGIGYETLSALNPKLVYCAISGYGSTGPFAGHAGHDLNYIAYAGVLEQLASRDGAPILPNFQIADLLGGASSAVEQILAALWCVARGGNGRFVDVSMTHTTHANNFLAQVSLANDGAAPPAGGGLLNGGVACYNLERRAGNRRPGCPRADKGRRGPDCEPAAGRLDALAGTARLLRITSADGRGSGPAPALQPRR